MEKADAPNIRPPHLLHLPPADKSPPTEISCNLLPDSSSSLSLPSILPAPGRILPFIMDVVAAVSGYISKMVTAGESAAGSSSTKMKILLLDSETVGLALD